MAQHLYLPDDWKSWIAENVLRGQSRQSLHEILVQKGFPSDLAMLEIQTAISHPYVAAASRLAKSCAKQEWLLHTLRVLESTASTKLIERTPSLSTDEFYTRFFRQNLPVCLTEVITRWRAIGVWNHDYLRRKVGKQVDEGSHIGSLASLQNDWDGLPEFLDASHSMSNAHVCIASVNEVTSLRHETENKLIAQILGQNRIQLVSPVHLPFMYSEYDRFSPVDLDAVDFRRFPNFKEVRVVEIVLEPGELLFLPVGWWYQVRSLDSTVAITFSRFLERNDFSRFYPSVGAT